MCQRWLPGTNVRLRDAWQGDLRKLGAGEPVTRTFVLVAAGLAVAALEALRQLDVHGLRQWPDHELLDD